MIKIDFVVLIIIGFWVSRVDISSFRIPDAAIITGFIAIIIMSVGGVLKPSRILAGIGIALVQTIFIRRITGQGMGLGDIKYAAFLGGLLGPSGWLLTGGLAGIGALLVNLPSIIRKRFRKNQRIPFAPYLTIAALSARVILGELS